MANKKIGRNDPCPCGSGKKYKHCCLGREDAAGRTPGRRDAPGACREKGLFGRAADWLKGRFDRPAPRQPQDGFGRIMAAVRSRLGFADPGDDERAEERVAASFLSSGLIFGESEARMAELQGRFCGAKGDGGDLFAAMDVNQQACASAAFREWLLSQTSPGEASDALSQMGAEPPAHVRAYLDEIPGSTLSLYEVQTLRGRQALLLDLLGGEEAPCFWADLADTGMRLRQWDIAVLRRGRSQSLLCSTLLGFDRPAGAELAARLKAELAPSARRGTPEAACAGQDRQDRQDRLVIRSWFDRSWQKAPTTFHPVRLDRQAPKAAPVKDVYRAISWDALGKALAGEAELVPVEGGWLWTLSAGHGRRAVCARLERSGDRLLCECRNEFLGDATRWLLEDKARGLVRFLSRRAEAERSMMDSPMPDADDPEARDAWAAEHLLRVYLGVLHQPLELLGGRPLAYAASLKTWRVKAACLLKHFENAEAWRDGTDMRHPLDLGCLWDHAGLERWPAQVRALLEQGPGN